MPTHPDNLPWTTTRCHRLLRPISTRIAALHKEQERERRVAGDARKAPAASLKGIPLRGTNSSQSLRPQKKRTFDSDLAWVPNGKPAAGNKRTYGRGRGRKAQTNQPEASDVGAAIQPGAIPFTPIIARYVVENVENVGIDSSPANDDSLRKRQDLENESVKNIMKQIPGKLAQGILLAYDNLLKTTSSNRLKPRKGARSLMRTCLRSMPGYIEVEEYFAQLDKEETDEDETRDISDEVYTYLEQTFGLGSDLGWRHLEEIVRAHGTLMMCHAFTDDVLGPEALRALVMLCLKQNALDEAEKFLWSFLPKLKQFSIPSSLQQPIWSSQEGYVRLAQEFADRTERHAFFYELLQHMVSRELLPLEWLATECMRPVWSRLVRALSEDDFQAFKPASKLLQATIYAGLGLVDDNIFQDAESESWLKQLKPSARQEFRSALDTTFSSLLTILASIAIVSPNQGESTDNNSSRRIVWLLDCIAIDLLRRNDIRSDLELLDTTTENMQTYAQRALWVMATSSLLHLRGCSLGPGVLPLDVPTLINSFSWVSYQYSCHDIDVSAAIATLPIFIASLASCSGKAQKDDGFDHLQDLANGLLSLSGIRLPHKLWTLKRVALETCMEFAQNTNDSRHFAYVQQMKSLMTLNGRIMLMQTPHKNDTPSAQGGFRWEEGIGEWVACTPFAKQDIRARQTKPIRALELLPTPEPSDSSQFGDDIVEDIWEEDAPPESFPVKKAPRGLRLVPGKRPRASSPMVVIPFKRVHLTPPDSGSSSLDNSFGSFSSFGSDTSASVLHVGPRRSSRSRSKPKETVAIKSRRTGTRKSARNVAPKTYAEAVPLDESEPNGDEEGSTDELAKTPAGKKAKRIANINETKRSAQHGRRGRPRKERQRSSTVDSTADGSEDELSFL